MRIKRIEVAAGLDALGSPEELTWDLFPLVPAEDTIHLDENGLPKIGTLIKPGMIIVGKSGKSSAYDETMLPTSLEVQGLAFQVLKSKFSFLWIDSSLRATDSESGRVVSATIVEEHGREKAIVELHCETNSPAD